MARYQVKTVVAVCFLEAAKITLEHLGQHRMGLSERNLPGSPELAAMYADLRRLREYLQRSVSARECVELDLAPADQALLVACCRRAVDVIDLRVVGGGGVSDPQRDWLMERRQVLVDWAVELAARPLLELPLPHLAVPPTHATKTFALRLNQRLFGADTHATVSLGPPPYGAPAGATQQRQSQQDARAEDAADGGGHAAPGTVPDAAGDAIGQESGARCFPHGMNEPGGEGRPQFALLDARQVRDPRLRSLVQLDQRAYERALAARDFRLAAVHLGSVLEGATLDHVLPRTVELGLAGTPDTWDPQEIILRLLGNDCTPRDRGMLQHAFVVRKLIRPAAQLVSPVVVTLQSLERLAQFVCRVLRELGFDARQDINYLRRAGHTAVAPPPVQ